MIWLVISGKGTGRLYVVKGMMRQDQYKDVLQNRLIPQLEEWFPNGEPYIFMQDGAHCHTARSILAFLAETNIPLLDWPGSSPDMNPIENVWELMKREVAKDVITNKALLLERIIHPQNGRIRVWQCRGERILTACISHCHTGPSPGVIVWDAMDTALGHFLSQLGKDEANKLDAVHVVEPRRE
ncbi:uncharacterized protein TNCV_4765041 [Trichonephila clavipes]|nr:uncharacterized protein TNCV_4765041 [Trichonephila clavipes]